MVQQCFVVFKTRWPAPENIISPESAKPSNIGWAGPGHRAQLRQTRVLLPKPKTTQVPDSLPFILWGAVCLPLITFLILFVGGRNWPTVADRLALTLSGLSLVGFSVVLAAGWLADWGYAAPIHWFSLGEFALTILVRVDALAALMLWVVAFISFLVQVFSVQYMRGDLAYTRYFALLGLFTFAMYGLLLTENLLVVYFFWELVGFSSYTLISFWSDKDAAVKAGRKAFLFNRAADLGFLAALLLLWAHYYTFNLSEIKLMVGPDSADPWFTWLGIGLLLGTAGKSAQFPLSGWLPDAMQGPTPVSALIHAATMVAAGVYLIIRADFLLNGLIMDVALIMGAITALGGALAATSQTDLKKVLAYSTISQLGYMVMAVGAGAPMAAFFHLVTHAFFKASLFLCAGSVIHHLAHGSAARDPQDMRQMGGLARSMPLVFACYTLSALALAGVPLLSGFLSKEQILSELWTAATRGSGPAMIAWVAALIGIGLTAFYIARQWFLVFVRPPGLPAGGTLPTPPKSPLSVWEAVPLLLLALFVPFWAFAVHPLEPTQAWIMVRLAPAAALPAPWWLAPLSLGLLSIGFGLAWQWYGGANRTILRHLSATDSQIVHRTTEDISHWDRLYHWVWSLVNQYLQKYVHWQGVDGIYEHFLVKIALQLAHWLQWWDKRALDRSVDVSGKITVVVGRLSAWFDRNVVDGLVRGLTTLIKRAGQMARNTQTGQIQQYYGWAVGMVVLVFLLILYWAQ